MAHDYTTDFTQAPPEEREFTVFEDGDYPFTILEINEFETSKKGNDMMPIKLQFSRPDGATVDVKEYLTFTEGALFKIRQFIASVGIPNGTRINFRDDEFRKYLKVKKGIATLASEDCVSKNGKEYKRNIIVAFVYEGTSKRDDGQLPPPHRTAPPVVEEEDDDVPF